MSLAEEQEQRTAAAPSAPRAATTARSAVEPPALQEPAAASGPAPTASAVLRSAAQAPLQAQGRARRGRDRGRPRRPRVRRLLLARTSAITRAPTTPTCRATSCRSRRRSPAPCVAINADDTDFVKAGQPLVTLDRADARGRARAGRGAARADGARGAHAVRQQRARCAAQIAPREADVGARAEPTSRARRTTSRAARRWSRTGAVGEEEFNHATAQLAAAQERALAAPSRRSTPRASSSRSNQSLTDGTTGREASERAARRGASVREAYLALQPRRRCRRRSTATSPSAACRSASASQAGRAADVDRPARRASGSTPTSRKSSCATCASASRSTLDGRRRTASKVDYHGTVEGLGAGTGAAFALLPAQNATGNWIKVVQRVPVRIALDPKELAEHPLRVGLSMDAKVDVARHERRDARRRAHASPAPYADRRVFDSRHRGGRRAR